MKPIFIREATAADVAYVASRLTEDDTAEVLALTGLPPTAALRGVELAGREVYVGGLADEAEKPVLIYGIDPTPHDGVAVVWLLTTPGVAENPREFMAALRQEWNRFHARFGVLTNWTMASNATHLRLLKWLGCEFVRTAPLGPKSVPFTEFVSVS